MISIGAKATRNLHWKYVTNQSFVMIGTSNDDDDQVWREFTAGDQVGG